MPLRIPLPADVGLELQTRVVIALEFGSDDQRHGRHQRDLILQEAAVEVLVELLRQKLHEQPLVELLRRSIFQAPNELLAQPRGELILELGIVRVQIVRERRGGKARVIGCLGRTCRVRLTQVGMVIIELQAHGRAVGRHVRPPAEQIAARKIFLADATGILGTVIEVPLQCQAIGQCRIVIQAKAAAAHLPRVERTCAGRSDLIASPRVLTVAPHVEPRDWLRAVAQLFLVVQLVAPGRLRMQSLCVARGLRDDVDHAVDGIGTPQGAAGPADDLDALDIGERIILYVPEDSAVERRVHGPPVDQHQELVREIRIEAAGADCPVVGVDLGDLEIIGEPQCLRQARSPGTADVFIADHLDGRRRLNELLGPP